MGVVILEHGMSADLSFLADLALGLPATLPPHPGFDSTIPHAPRRPIKLSKDQTKLALQNALRYFPPHQHADLAPEFLAELEQFGHIYMHRFRPTYTMKAYPISAYPARIPQAAAMQHMIMNNLDHRVAQYPHELVTYGGNGQVFQNWAQYHLVMKYLSELDSDQTLVMYSGHPMGLFPSNQAAPRCVITNGMMIPRFSTKEMYETLFAQGNTMYGQMTAGSWCYIGPQGIVHGTTITILNAARKYLGRNDLAGVVYVSSGLGGMSGAQSKAATICGAVSVIAETDLKAITKRHSQGWVNEISTNVDECIERIKFHKNARNPVSIAFHGNIVTLWERLAEEKESLVELGSDQTSCHNVFAGGYIPVQLTHEEASRMLSENPEQFKQLVNESLVRQVQAINTLTTERGMKFWDYGNSFLLEASRAGADVLDHEHHKDDGVLPVFRYPSYVQHIMGDIFSLGFGPFRWICTSADEKDLLITDRLAQAVLERIEPTVPEPIKGCVQDNLLWIRQAQQNKLVVGSQARILYADQQGRVEIAVAFNDAIRDGVISGPIVLSRDHHDVSGTDSPFRETSNITDGSSVCADMAVQNVIGDAARGASWVSLHNGGGVGWGEVMNGGFGLVLDGTPDAEARARGMLAWDVSNGISRRAWAGNANARLAISRSMQANPGLVVTMANDTDSALLDRLLS
eukprot:c9109_g1_i1.p1 GENE.c9109_g1_i1~~c9109_g1_i1.p1  ORF type:complete len:688 (+),score=181.85 c9109_g1_i1:1-2064(+)